MVHNNLNKKRKKESLYYNIVKGIGSIIVVHIPGSHLYKREWELPTQKRLLTTEEGPTF